MLFANRNRKGGLDFRSAQRVESAAEALNVGAPRWSREGATFQVGGASRSIEGRDLARALAPGPAGVHGPLVEAIGLATALGVQPPIALVGELRTAKPLLLPRLFNERELTGPRRAMCRRECHGGLIRAIGMGDGPAAPVVTTAMLDQWATEFEVVWAAAMENLGYRLGPESLDELEGAPGVLAMADPLTPASAGAFVLDRMCPDAALGEGVVFSTPRHEALLAMPVQAGSGADGLAGLVQATHALAGEIETPLSDQLFWWRFGEVVHLPMTAIDESRSRRVHMEARGPVEDLLRVLGVVD